MPRPLPSELIHSLQNIKGFEEEAFLKVHSDGNQITSIRINPAKSFFPDSASGPIPWTSYGFYLPVRPSFTFDPLLHAGCYYVQEASSMFLEQALKQVADLAHPLKVLDLCAAPGGKSTHIQSLLSPESFLISNEVIKARANILAENMTKWGGANVVVTNNDPKDFSNLYNYFDVIVLDAPCSGSGLFRRDNEAIKEWSEESVQLCSQRQQRIIADILPCLKSRGVFVYSTCSYSRQEDEDIVDWMLEDFPLESKSLVLDAGWGIIHSASEKLGGHGYRFYPDKVKGEGFFMAVLQKKEMDESSVRPPKKNKPDRPSKNESAVLQQWIKSESSVQFIKWKEYVLAMSSLLDGELPLLQQHLYIKQAGVNLGQITPQELIPAHAFATSNLVRESISRISLTKDQAIEYLRKDEISKSDFNGRGWSLVQYDGHNLGWVKLLPNRINNYYPKEWRILKQV